MNKERMKEVLDNTVSFYNLNNRALSNGNCVYVSENSCCAVGRLLTDDLKELVIRKGWNDDSGIGTLYESSKIQRHFSKQGLTLNFLLDLQTLHDEKAFWTEDGISEQGKEWVSAIQEEWGL